MDNESIQSREQLAAFVVEELKAGTSRALIAQKLYEKGLDNEQAAQLVQNIYTEVMPVIEKEKLTVASLLPAIFGGAIAALAGGYLWSLVVTTTEYEIGYMAWGIGLLAGFAVLKLSGGKRGIPLQALAVTASVAGIVLGQYLTYHHFVREAALLEYGPEAVSDFTVFSASSVQFFIEDLGSMVNGFDAIWIILAVVTAWKIPKGLSLKSAS